MKIVRSQEEIVTKINNLDDDIFSVKVFNLIDYLDYKHAKQYLEDNVTAKDWSHYLSSRDFKTPLSELVNYLPFAFDKAQNERGLSALRSLHHMEIWLWLMGDDDMVNIVKNDNSSYGIDALNCIKNKYAPNLEI